MSIPVWFVALEPPSLYSSQPSTTGNTARKCKLVYLNEGGANFVFRILAEENDELPRPLRRKLLRIPKNLSHVVSAEEQLQALDTNFTQLFPADNLIHHELIKLDAGVPQALNRMLVSLIRPNHRLDDLLPSQAMSGMLVTDMTPDVGEVLLQLKPKWLAQSLNAPSEARRCRTCAVRAHRASERIRTVTDAQESCPLELVSSDVAQRQNAVHAVTTDVLIREYLLIHAQPLLQQLRVCQLEFDRHGVLRTSGTDAVFSLCKAMTLRDCTLFVKRSGNSVEGRLGDLDLKHPEKFPRWKKVEANLIAGGWYTNTENRDHLAVERVCLLSR
ncbi:Putative inositol-pentakisphosphate 2-kinase [Septoria linicola]|uniref:Inositol-pentakisphosphate 2-kinase n=1 Tax=Septoria linicola TaxID=215465 RepID=A0A9Q9AUR5_9PEZI|nr:putative inositol-pentakisphosphate 2-kinase [Septoria linicola]USW52362.1 Putative inositol-pentakisphosphate 2-kinase [Septoria linicola]